jgi:hypothetical protein
VVGLTSGVDRQFPGVSYVTGDSHAIIESPPRTWDYEPSRDGGYFRFEPAPQTHYTLTPISKDNNQGTFTLDFSLWNDGDTELKRRLHPFIGELYFWTLKVWVEIEGAKLADTKVVPSITVEGVDIVRGMALKVDDLSRKTTWVYHTYCSFYARYRDDHLRVLSKLRISSGIISWTDWFCSLDMQPARDDPGLRDDFQDYWGDSAAAVDVEDWVVS